MEAGCALSRLQLPASSPASSSSGVSSSALLWKMPGVGSSLLKAAPTCFLQWHGQSLWHRRQASGQATAADSCRAQRQPYLANQPMMGAAAQPARQQGRHILLYPVAACQKLDEEPSRADCTCQSQACELSVTLRNLFCRSLRPLRMTESLHLMILNPAPQGCERNRLMSQQLGQISCFQLLLRSAAGSAACSHPDNRISESSSICGHHLDQRAPHRTRAPSKVKICLAAVKVEARRG